ncbi:unnamed protein product, partial [Ixodes pacificus]
EQEGVHTLIPLFTTIGKQDICNSAKSTEPHVPRRSRQINSRGWFVPTLQMIPGWGGAREGSRLAASPNKQLPGFVTRSPSPPPRCLTTQQPTLAQARRGVGTTP